MAYDEVMADRIRDVVDVEPGISDRRMFGGVAFKDWVEIGRAYARTLTAK